MDKKEILQKLKNYRFSTLEECACWYDGYLEGARMAMAWLHSVNGTPEISIMSGNPFHEIEQKTYEERRRAEEILEVCLYLKEDEESVI